MKVNVNRTKIPEGHRLLTKQEKIDFANRYGISVTQANKMLKDATVSTVYETLTEGSKVKINYERIMSNKENMSERYLEFITNHKDQIMTVKYDPKHTDNPTVFCLEEDDSEVKWLFDVSDLILVELADPQETN